MGVLDVAGQTPTAGALEGLTLPADAPPMPIAPATISRDMSGKATIRATRLAMPLRIDGKLDEAVFSEIEPISGFIQQEPKAGLPASEKTDVWVLYDENNVYVVCRCWESRPDLIVGNEMRRDHVNIVQNDQFAFSFDTFFDKRNAVFFEVSASGGRIDGQVVNERSSGLEWNPIWSVKTSRFEQGYIVEAAVPFKSIRYQAGRTQLWGMQVRRRNMWRNEYSFLTAIPPSVGSAGHFRVSLAATVVGLEVPDGGSNIDVKPFVTSSLTSDKTARPVIDNDPDGDVGVDVKMSVGRGLTADFTVNTDFAQVEADEQQINLTRFNLFIPEKREFFLENAGLFQFGQVSADTDTPTVFYSRNIGLHEGREVPILAGGRLTGRAGRFTIGALNLQTGGDSVVNARATNFSVLRVRRDILRSSNVGLIATNRSVGAESVGANRVYGVDGAFSFGPDVVVHTFWTQSKTDGVQDGDNMSYRALFDYTADRYGVQMEHVTVEAQFDPQVGFARRRDMAKNFVQLRFSPRPKNAKLIRKYSYQGSFTNIENTAGRLETRSLEGRFGIDFQNSDTFAVSFMDNFEFLPSLFRIAPAVTLPLGEYDFSNARIAYNFGRQRALSGNVSVDHGTFYDGNKTTWNIGSGRFNVGPRISVEPSLALNQVAVSAGVFKTTLVTTRAAYTMSPWMFVSALLQYNSGPNSFATNARFRWEYSPGSELFVVYNDQRDTLVAGFPSLVNRALIVKVNRTFRF